MPKLRWHELFALLLVWLVGANCRRQASTEHVLQSSKALSGLFRALTPVVAFNPSYPGVRAAVDKPILSVAGSHAAVLAELEAHQQHAATRAQPIASAAVDDEIGSNNPGLVLRPSSPSEPTQWDSACIAMPVVLPPAVTGSGKWHCYYYGNAGTWAAGYKNFLPTGWTGLAESDDGIHWTKVVGKEQGGSILAPTGNPDDWDGIHLGVSDVIRISDNELHMYYFGGSGEEVQMGPGRSATGLRMRIGRARSTDGGRTWERMGMVLDYSAEEGIFASWPRIMLPASPEEEPWKMVYHAFTGQKWFVYGATSLDQGKTWTRDGMLLGPGEDDAWDGAGIGTRTVARTQKGDWLMVYEAVDGSQGPFAGKHRLGVARLTQSDDASASKWEKDLSISSVPGGPILDPGMEPLPPWTSQVIGTPYLLPMEDGSLRLYFCSKRNPSMNMSIGLVVSDTGDLSPSSWRPVSP